jgi:hypothetical protein
VIEESQFREALGKASVGDDPDVVLMEFIANSDGETVTQGIAPTCGECGGVVFWRCSKCGDETNHG